MLAAIILPWTASAGQPQDQFTFILPAPALHQTLQKNLPLMFTPESSSFDGKLSIDSIDRLSIHDAMISLHGIISGKNLSLTTKIAGQNLKIKLGQVILPLSCDLHLRFDPSSQQLFITPHFKPSEDNSGNGQALLPLLAALGTKEYPVDLKELQSLKPSIGGQDLNLQLEPVQVTAANNQLVLGLRPKKIKSD
jgi:hypothetical protein